LQYIEALFKVLPVILLILTSIFLRKKQFIELETVQDIKKLVVNIPLPALLFMAFSRVNIETPHLIIVMIVFAACLRKAGKMSRLTWLIPCLSPS